MRTQHYKVPAKAIHLEQGAPGQFVFGEEGDEIIGFIDFVSDCEVAIMLFVPMDVPDDIGAVCIAEECDYMARLREIFDEYPEIADMWRM